MWWVISTSTYLIWRQWTPDMEARSLDLKSPKQYSSYFNTVSEYSQVLVELQVSSVGINVDYSEAWGFLELLVYQKTFGLCPVQASPGSLLSLLNCLSAPVHTSFCPATKVTILNHKNLITLFVSFKFFNSLAVPSG